jgi:signal transduction histidine kinase
MAAAPDGSDGPALARWVHRDDRAQWDDAWTRLSAGETADAFTLRFRTAKGGFGWFRVHCAPFGGRVTGTLEDVDAERRAEGEVRSLTESLRRTRDQAARASRAKSEFLAMMSHEIRTPLSGMMGMVTLLRSTALDAEQRRFTGSLWSSSSLLLQLVNDVLDFSRLDAGRMELDIKPFGLRALADSVVDVLSPEARA